ncbi:MAG: hypothetical protein AAF938_20130, partial [Myxococcota bacterium]
MQCRFSLCVLLTAAGCATSSSPEPARISDRALACVRLSGCVDFEQGSATGYAACMQGFNVDGVRPRGPEVSSCVLAAGSCDEALACVGAEARSPCADAQPSCDGDVLRDCFAGVEVQRDCASEGLSCIDNGNSTCGREVPCITSRCEDDRLLTCVVGSEREVARECEPDLCDVDASGFGRCLPSLEPCERGTAFCDGDIAVGCPDGFAVRTLCLPGQCRDTDGAFCFTLEACESTCQETNLLA